MTQRFARVLFCHTTSSREHFFAATHIKQPSTNGNSEFEKMGLLKLSKLPHLNQIIDRYEHSCSHSQFTVQSFSAFVQQSIILMATQRLKQRHANRQDNPTQTVIHRAAGPWVLHVFMKHGCDSTRGLLRASFTVYGQTNSTAIHLFRSLLWCSNTCWVNHQY